MEIYICSGVGLSGLADVDQDHDMRQVVCSSFENRKDLAGEGHLRDVSNARLIYIVDLRVYGKPTMMHRDSGLRFGRA